MAAVSTPFSSRNLPSNYDTAQRDSDQWDFSAPDPLESQPPPSHSRSNNPQSPIHNHDTPPFTHQNGYTPNPTDPSRLDGIEQNTVNGISTPKTLGRGQNKDPTYLSPFRDSNRPDLTGSRSGSEPDSLLDLYGNRRSPAPKSIRRNSQDSRRGEYHPDHEFVEDEEDPDKSRWIHRDKLLLIESREMQELGIKPPPPKPSSSSRAKSRREPSQERYINGSLDHEPEVGLAKESKRRRLQSPIRTQEEDEPTNDEYDLRKPEEIAEDPNLDRSTSAVYRHQGLRSSSSRIPLPRSSPMPIPQGHIERNQPLPRKRGTSSGEEDITYPHSRSRNQSFSSQILLDDNDNLAANRSPTQNPSSSRPPSQGSLIKTRNNTITNNLTRKSSTNTPTSTQKSRHQTPPTTSPRTPSTSTPSIRRRSRSEIEPRPPTAINRPEGDPPWLKEMYKPDPRLPPEQQILPTHAKRLQQEQWAQAAKEAEARQREREKQERKEGREPLAVHTGRGLQPSNKRMMHASQEHGTKLQQGDDTTAAGGGGEWPLHHHDEPSASSSKYLDVRNKPLPPPNARLTPSPVSPISSENGKGGGGYSTMPPRAKQPPPQESFGVGMAGKRRPGDQADPATVGVSDPFEKERMVKEEDGKRGDDMAKAEKKEKTAGCACCVVM